MPKCEVNGCKEFPEHSIGLGNVKVAVCNEHRVAVGKIARRHAHQMLNAVSDIHDQFIYDVINLEEEECPTNTPK